MEGIGNYMHILVFFTTWNLLIVIFHTYTYDKLHLLYLSFITLLGCLYLSLVNPKRFVYRLGKDKYVFTGTKKLLYIDIPFHFIIFAFVYYLYNDYYRESDHNTLMLSCILLLGYACIVDIKNVYGIRFVEFLCVFAICNLLYFAIF